LRSGSMIDSFTDEKCIERKCRRPARALRIICAVRLLALGAGLPAVWNLCTQADENARWPEEGGWVEQNGLLVLDESNLSQGYILARSSDYSSARLKLRVVYGDTHLDYDLPGDATYTVIPLQMGSGSYQVLLYQNTSGKKYAEVGNIWIYAELEREDVAFLYPNQYINYSIYSAAVEAADQLCDGKSDREAFQSVCSFMSSGFVYDFIKAITISAGMLPDIDGAYEKKMGICQDLAAIMCCMLRTQGIPARMIIGYADNNYHAWTQTVIDGVDEFYDPTAAINAISAKVYSAERSY